MAEFFRLFHHKSPTVGKDGVFSVPETQGDAVLYLCSSSPALRASPSHDGRRPSAEPSTPLAGHWLSVLVLQPGDGRTAGRVGKQQAMEPWLLGDIHLFLPDYCLFKRVFFHMCNTVTNLILIFTFIWLLKIWIYSGLFVGKWAPEAEGQPGRGPG